MTEIHTHLEIKRHGAKCDINHFCSHIRNPLTFTHSFICALVDNLRAKILSDLRTPECQERWLCDLAVKSETSPTFRIWQRELFYPTLDRMSDVVEIVLISLETPFWHNCNIVGFAVEYQLNTC